MKSNPVGSIAFSPMARGAWILALALAAGPLAWAQQDQPPAPTQDNQQQQQGQNQDRPPQPPPPPAQDKAQQPPPQNPQPGGQRRVISRDTLPGNDANQDRPYEGQQPPDRPGRGQMPYDRANGGPQGSRAPQTWQPVPDALTLPAGTVLQIRTNDFLSSDQSKAGDHFTAVLAQPLVVNGWVVARRGETIEGQVIAAKKAGRVKGVSQLELQLTNLTLVDGQVLPVQTALWQGSGGTSHGADAATIATTTGLGAAIGAAANLGTGAAVGAGAGLLTGIGAVLLTRGRPTIVPPESPLSFQLTTAVNIQTAQGKQAYLPVRPADYENRGVRRPVGPYRVGYPVPPPYCGYYRPCFVGPYGYYRAY